MELRRARPDDDDALDAEPLEFEKEDALGLRIIGKGGDGLQRTARGDRGGHFDALHQEGREPGAAMRSVEGWWLIVTGLPAETSEEELREHFSAAPGLRGLRLRGLNRDPSCCIGHAFVEYDTEESARAAMARFSGAPFLSAPRISADFAFVAAEHGAAAALGKTPAEETLKRKRGERGSIADPVRAQEEK